MKTKSGIYYKPNRGYTWNGIFRVGFILSLVVIVFLLLGISYQSTQIKAGEGREKRYQDTIRIYESLMRPDAFKTKDKYKFKK